MIVWAAWAAGAAALILSAAITPAAMRIARRTGFVAAPSPDRHHSRPTPLLGGVAILAGILIPSAAVLALAVFWNARGVPAWLPGGVAVHVPGMAARAPLAAGILAGAVALHVIGLIDDRRRLGPWLKLVGQLAVATAVVVGGRVRLLELLGEPFSSIATIGWLVVVINAMNFLDNVDGLAAGVTAICSAALLAAAAGAGQLFVAGWLVLLLGASLGFLVHNFPPAKVFMGDAGSLVLGYFLAVLTVLTTYYRPGPAGRGAYYGVFAPVVLLAVPLYDTASVMFLRIRRGRSPWIGDTSHFSHRLLARGMSPRKAVLTIYLATAATAAGAVLLPRVGGAGASVVFAQTVGIVLIIALLESADRGGRQ